MYFVASILVILQLHVHIIKVIIYYLHKVGISDKEQLDYAPNCMSSLKTIPGILPLNLSGCCLLQIYQTKP